MLISTEQKQTHIGLNVRHESGDVFFFLHIKKHEDSPERSDVCLTARRVEEPEQSHDITCDMICQAKQTKKKLPLQQLKRKNNTELHNEEVQSAAAESFCGLQFALACMIKPNCVTLRLHSCSFSLLGFPLDPNGSLKRGSK